MPMDGLTLGFAARELDAALAGGRIDKVSQPEKDTIVLLIRAGSENRRLLLCASPNNARCHLTWGAFPNPLEPPMFCMLLRKHLVGARIESLVQPDFERLLILNLDARDEMGAAVKKQLVVEMLGRQSNVILVGPEGHVIDCMRRVDSAMSEVRPVLPGLLYRLPLRQEKPVLFDTAPEQRRALLAAMEPGAAVDKWLLNTFSGLSPLTCRELCHRAFGEGSPRFQSMTDAQQDALLSAMDELTQRVAAGALEPVMLLDGAQPKDFSFWPVTQYEGARTCTQCGSFSELLDEFYLRRDKAEAMRRKSQALTRSVKTVRDRTAKKLALQQEDLKRSADREATRRRADLITANLYRMKKGDRTLVAQDFYEEGCPEVEIPLDPLKTPQQNAAALYKAYQKSKTAEAHLTKLIGEAEQSLNYLNSVLDELARAEGERDLAEIRAELRATGYLRREKANKREKTQPRAPLRFVSSTGYDILVGRSNTQNDELTHKLARRTDIWLHTQKVHGSHVIIRARDTQPDAQTLEEAASLAVYYSQARGGGKTPVDYTMARFVRKPSGALPGMVIYTEYQTCMAESDEALAVRLMAK